VKLVRHIKICLKETYSQVHIGKNLLDAFLIQKGLEKGEALSSLLFNFALEYATKKVQENQDTDSVNTLSKNYHKEKQRSYVRG
jgi:hypothetical protein